MGHDELAATRRSLHGVAELVLAGPQYRATGRLTAFAAGESPVLWPEHFAAGRGRARDRGRGSGS
jgi:hypothetical protein